MATKLASFGKNTPSSLNPAKKIRYTKQRHQGRHGTQETQQRFCSYYFYLCSEIVWTDVKAGAPVNSIIIWLLKTTPVIKCHN